MKKRRMRKEFIIKAGIIISITLLLVGAFVLLGERKKEEPKTGTGNSKCSTDTDCVPASCCHAASCVAKEQAPQCSGVYCTQVCLPDTLDCNQARCACIEKRCRVVKSEGE